MSAVWLKLITILCLCCTGLSDQENGEVVWKKPGEDFTIQCKPPGSDYTLLSLKRGLKKDEIFVQDKDNVEPIISLNFTVRMQLNGDFPNINFFIKNVTANDTGPYWCIYTKFDGKVRKPVEKHGKGSVLLVVKEANKETTCETMENPSENLVLVSVVISAVVLLAIILGLLIWILKGKTVCRTVKQQRVPTNDVYEDMRGTMGR